MKRIGIDAHVLTGKYQGSRTVLLELLSQIGHHDKHNEYIIYSFAPEKVSRLLNFNNFTHRSIPFHSSIVRLLFFWPYAHFKDSLDLLITQYNCPPLYPWKQAVIIHDILFETHPQFFPPIMRWRLRIFTRLSAHQAEAIFVVSEYTKKALKDAYRINNNKIHLIRNGYNKIILAECDKVPLNGLDRYILCVGRLEPRKNIETVLNTFIQMDQEDLQLVIVGKADFSSDHLLLEMKKRKNVIHIQEASRPELATLYRHAKLFIYPSFAEGFGLPLLEALSFGVPVISSNQTALPEVGGDLVTYFDPTSPEAVHMLAESIGKVLASPAKLDEEKLLHHLEGFDWLKSALKLISILERM